jgi:hypothetical protein
MKRSLGAIFTSQPRSRNLKAPAVARQTIQPVDGSFEGKFTTRNLEPLHEVGGARKKAFGGR